MGFLWSVGRLAGSVARGASATLAARDLVLEIADRLRATPREAEKFLTSDEDADSRAELANAVPLQSEPHFAILGSDRETRRPAPEVENRTRELLQRSDSGRVEGVAVPTFRTAAWNKFDTIVARASDRYGVPADIIKAVIAVESSYRENAIREEPRIADRSRGLMQLLERTARGLGFTGPFSLLFDPEVNIFLGAQLLAELYARFGNWRDALAAYNGGTARKTSSGELVPILAEYVAKVNRYLGQLGRPAVGSAGAALGVLLLVGAGIVAFARGARS